MADWVAMSSLRLSTRSAISPPHGPMNSTGPNCSATVMLSMRALPVRWSTSQPCAIDCIQVPLIEMIWAMKYSR